MRKTAPNILVYHREADKYANVLREHGYTSIQTASTREEALLYLKETDVILSWRFPTDLLTGPEAAKVRWIQSTGAGIDDLVTDSNIPSNIKITRILDQFGGLISEYVFAYLLYITKELPRMREAQAQSRWEPFKVGTLKGKVIGVAGLGSIGSEIVRKARAFDMTVYGLSFSGTKADLVDQHYDATNWESFVRELDYLILTLPLTPATHHVINKEIMSVMKPNASIVNVGRGQLVSEEDLVAIMEEGLLHAAVLDVFENEPLDPSHPLWSLPNVYVTPHLSGQSNFEEVGRFFVDNLRLFEQGAELIGTVNRQRGY
ncbi:D-2-hydroxyacid dehydrogenase [Paenibacillus sp. UNC451MF]|uniref:D-2-hydroxyacid dehydrogenase n=1 Tax=Paenibacillus sp. UNC451MF TaxID=1449063 RepID=UPI00048FE781|nr:D-2-hydroxyacid dehydrogenase [Paenibacillus sp. UNC451MF]